jgi:hypothetical protein
MEEQHMADYPTTNTVPSNMSSAQRSAYHMAHACLRNAAPHIRQAYDNFVLAGVPQDSLMKVLAVLQDADKQMRGAL